MRPERYHIVLLAARFNLVMCPLSIIVHDHARGREYGSGLSEHAHDY